MGKSFGCCNSPKEVVMSPPPSHSAVTNPPDDDPKSGCSLLKAMGKLCGCYTSSGNHVPNPPDEAVEAEYKPSLEEIVRRIHDTNPTEQIDPLTRCIEDQLRLIKAPSGGITLETVSSGMDIGGQLVDTISKEADKLKTEKIMEGMGKMAIDALNTIAGTHWIFVGLSVVGYALRTYIRVNSNASGCIELLEKLAELAKDLSEFKESGPGGEEKLSKAVHVIIKSAVMCRDYINKGTGSRLVN